MEKGLGKDKKVAGCVLGVYWWVLGEGKNTLGLVGTKQKDRRKGIQDKWYGW